MLCGMFQNESEILDVKLSLISQCQWMGDRLRQCQVRWPVPCTSLPLPLTTAGRSIQFSNIFNVTCFVDTIFYKYLNFKYYEI
jgi:hypothetical protein